MNLREVIRSGFKQFNRMGMEKKKAHIEAVQYIQTLATQTGTKMELWDIGVIFSAGRGNELVTDRQEINRIFFAKLEELRNNTPAQVAQLTTQVQNRINEITRHLADRQITELTRNRDSAQRQAVDAMTRANQHIADAARWDTQLRTTTGRESTVSDQIGRLVQENFWEFHSMDGELLVLTNRTPITMSEQNRAAGVDIRVLLGRFKVTINLRTFAVQVFPFEDNVIFAGACHPHVWREGNVCWGTAASVVGQKLPIGEIYDVMKLLETILTTYNPGSPINALINFKNAAEQQIRDREVEERAQEVASQAAVAAQSVVVPDNLMTPPRTPGDLPPIFITQEQLRQLQDLVGNRNNV